jgi:tetratricopeptide (TPR) repeat protein
MNAAPLDLLEPDELLMLALQASGAGDSAAAIAYLKLALSKAPADARAHWAIAAEYAALKLPERAAQHFASAVELDPQQPVARFQYGLLMLTSGRIDEAQAIWEPLAALSPDDPVRLFKEGLLHMVRDEFDAALASLRAALAQPGLDPALGRDVEMTIGRIEEVQKGNAVQAPAAAMPAKEAPAGESVESHLALSAYRTGGFGGSH